MSVPAILVIDDQFASDDTERALFLHRTGLVEVGSEPAGGRIGEAGFCSGQIDRGASVENDYATIRQAVANGPPRGGRWNLILLDVRFDSGPRSVDGIRRGQPGDDAFGEVVAARLLEDLGALPLVLLTSKQQHELDDHDLPYLSKDGLDEHALRVCLLRHGELESDQRRDQLAIPPTVAACAPATLAAFLDAFALARSDVAVLILGESGTGKEVLARYIHERSGRDGPFIGVNVAAIPRELLESELFGHVRGAFTGAVSDKPGTFESAQGGTVLLDEIADMPLELQVKLLRVLQERAVVRLGSHTPIHLDVRVISATSRDLATLVLSGAFREDLYFRIVVAALTLPPLRERREEIVPLAEVKLAEYASVLGKRGLSFSSDARRALEAHDFAGNVRELENVVQLLVGGVGNNRVISAREVESALASADIGRPRTANAHRSQDRAETAMETPSVRLEDLPALLDSVAIDLGDKALKGAKARLDDAYTQLLRRLAGAALECYRDRRGQEAGMGKINLQGAMQFLTGKRITGKDPSRLISGLLDRRQHVGLTDEDLELLVDLWRRGRRS